LSERSRSPTRPSPGSIDARVAAGRLRLRAAGIAAEEAGLDARLLAEHALGWTTARLLTDGARTPPAAFAATYDALIERRARREPTAYILGSKEFWALRFDVSPAVLVPRPETELVVAAALARLPGSDAPVRIADVGTGSGCLAVALAVERPNAQVVATDASVAALEVASINASRHGVSSRVRFLMSDLLGADADGFDMIVSNPPYVPDRDKDALPPEVRDYEPSSALFAGPDGLTVIRRLLPLAAERLVVAGWLIFEFGFGQAEAITQLVAATPALTLWGVDRDLAGIPRVAIVQRA
jgi:release factor glutamine methyltransferase